MAVSRTGQHSSVILPIIYFHPLKRPRLRLQSGLPAALPFSLESRERLHSGDNRVHRRSTFQKGPLACSGSVFGAWPLIESLPFSLFASSIPLREREKTEGKKRCCNVRLALFFPPLSLASLVDQFSLDKDERFHVCDIRRRTNENRFNRLI